MDQETIAAIATPPGDGAISLIRISGPRAFLILESIFSRTIQEIPSHTAICGKIFTENQQLLDEVLVLIMRNGHSYTGEDVAEIMCHGGFFVTNKILRVIFSQGARPAKPGEFTLRAFLNGRIDLTQAEAVQEIIAAKNDTALMAATHQLSGRLSLITRDFQQIIVNMLGMIEAVFDYGEEIPEIQMEIAQKSIHIKNKMQVLARSFHTYTLSQKEKSICLLGPPNAGKSSLMNALLHQERAIVTNIPGTTRDLLHEQLSLHGHLYHLFDTAGMHTTREHIEKEGIKRATEQAAQSDLIILLFDATETFTKDHQALLQQYPTSLLVWNKIDLLHTPLQSSGIVISAKNGTGLETLQNAIINHFHKDLPPKYEEEILLTKERHAFALNQAIQSIDCVIRAQKDNLPLECVAIDLKRALQSLNELIGINITENVLEAIFTNFCVGK